MTGKKDPPKLDFLWKDKETFTRPPKLVAEYEYRHEGEEKIPINTVYYDDVLTEVLRPSRENNRLIMFVDAIGAYQTGKTTLHKALTRNVAHEAGDGQNEKTLGVYIDGPYEIKDLIEGYGFEFKDNLGKQSPHVYFLDIEGFDGFRNGSCPEIATKLYQKLAIPFVGLSAVHLLMIGQENEGLSKLQTIFTTIQLSDLSHNIDGAQSSLIFGINKCQRVMYDCDFDKITKESSNKVSEEFAKSYREKLKSYNITFRLRCLPYIDPNWPRQEQIPGFKAAYDIFVEDIFLLIKSAADSSCVHYYEQVIEHFNVLKNSVNTPSFKTDVNQSLHTQIQRTLEIQINGATSAANEYIDERVSKRESKIFTSHKFDIEQWNQKVSKYLKTALDKYDEYLLPGIRIKPESRLKREALQTTLSSMLQNKGNEIFYKMSPQFMQEADLIVKREYHKKKQEIQENLKNQAYYCENAKSIDKLVTKISDELKKLMLSTIKAKMTNIPPNEEIEIERRMQEFSSLIEADLRLMFKDAEMALTTRKPRIDTVDNEEDKTRIISVYETEIDPYGNESEEVLKYQHSYPISIVDDRSFFDKLIDFIVGLFSSD